MQFFVPGMLGLLAGLQTVSFAAVLLGAVCPVP